MIECDNFIKKFKFKIYWKFVVGFLNVPWALIISVLPHFGGKHDF